MSSAIITKNDLIAILQELGTPFTPLDYYPVGSYYETSDTTFNPNTAWGGTWVLEAEGQVHVSAGSNYTVSGAATNTSDGGTNTHNHSTGDFTLQTSHIPAHTHGNKSLTGSATFRKWGANGHLFAGRSGIITSIQGEDSATGYPMQTMSGSTPKLDKLTIDASHTHDSVGGDGAHNHGNTGNGSNMPPYIVVNRWHRTA